MKPGFSPFAGIPRARVMLPVKIDSRFGFLRRPAFACLWLNLLRIIPKVDRETSTYLASRNDIKVMGCIWKQKVNNVGKVLQIYHLIRREMTQSIRL